MDLTAIVILPKLSLDFDGASWKVFYDSATPQTEKFPGIWNALSNLDRSVQLNILMYKHSESIH